MLSYRLPTGKASERCKADIYRQILLKARLTLTIEKSVIERAKSYAKNTGRSLSELIESYLESVIRDERESTLSPRLKKIVRAANVPENLDEEKEIRDAIEKKHL